MTRDVIENGWLRPASTLKTNIKEQLKEEREKAKKTGNLGSYDALYKQLKKEHGRIPLGEKGVGRFATHRLGRYLELRTKTKDVPYELILKIDWQEFDKISSNKINLNSIGISLFRGELSKDYGERDSGTKLIIYGGKNGFEWDKEKIMDLTRSIVSLNSPTSYGNKADEDTLTFKALFECPQLEEELPKSPVYADSTPNFTFEAWINEKGELTNSKLNFKHPTNKIPPQEWQDKNIDLRIINLKDPDYWYLKNGDKRKPECGAYYIQMSIWYRTKEWIDFPVDYRELTRYLDDYGGMSVYRDGILVTDAKINAEYDWLGLSKKHIKQGFRLSYRDFIGHIKIDQIQNPELIDKTNREGFIENQAENDISTLTTTAIEMIILPRYIEKRDDLTKLTKGLITDATVLKDITKTSATFLTNVSDSEYPLESDPYEFFRNLWEKVEERREGIVNLKNSMGQLQTSIQRLEDVQDMFVEQAGFGIAVAMSLHEINKITANFYAGITELIKAGEFDKIKLETLKATSNSLKSELIRLSPLRSIRNENRTEFNILNSINYASEIYKRKMKELNIELEILNPEENFIIYGRYSTMNQIFGNLFDNSIYWLRYANKEKKCIKIQFNEQYRTVIVSDSGNDVSDIIRPYLFQPGYSLKQPPSGLGLFICKSYLNSMNARIYETPQKDRIKDMPGAHFTLDFHKTPKEKELEIKK